MPAGAARTLHRGEQPTPGEFAEIKKLMDAHPGLTGIRYRALVAEQIGIKTSVGTIYNWMKVLGVETSRRLRKSVPAVNIQERRRLSRLLKHVLVPGAEEVRASRDLSRAGVDEIEFRDGILRLAWDADGIDFACWLTAREDLFLRELLGRFDRTRQTDLLSQFTLLQKETAGYIGRAMSYALAADEYGDRVGVAQWKMMRESGTGGPPRGSHEAEAEWLLRTGRRLRGRARSLVSETRMAAGL